MKKSKIGRNDPCPCGSGKKYKRCCGRLQDIAKTPENPFDFYNQLLSALKLKLDQYYGSQIKKNRKEAQKQFLRYSVDGVLPPEHESIFSDWLWFDKTDISGKNPGSRYLEEHGDFLEKPLQECLASLTASHLAIYQTEGLKDNCLFLNDIFSGKQYKVLLKEPWDLKQDESPLLLLGRLINIDETSIFSGMVLVTPNKAGKKEFIEKHLQYVQEICPDQSENLLKIRGEAVYGIFDHAHKKTFMNLNDIRAAGINAAEKEKLIDKLTQNKDCTLVHKTGGFHWFKPTGENRGYIRIAVGEKHILTCADILDDVQKIQELLTDILEDKEFVQISSLFLQKPPAAEVVDLWFAVLKDQETEKWLITPHAELDNKTPQQILEETNGRQRILEMLNNFAASVHSEEEKELIEYMKLRIG